MEQWRTFLSQCEIVLHCALFSSEPQRHIKSTKGCLKGKKNPLYSLPTGSSIQCVMEDQSLWPTAGLQQPLAEPHTNKWALGILYNWNLIVIKDNIHGVLVRARWHLYKLHTVYLPRIFLPFHYPKIKNVHVINKNVFLIHNWLY